MQLTHVAALHDANAHRHTKKAYDKIAQFFRACEGVLILKTDVKFETFAGAVGEEESVCCLREISPHLTTDVLHISGAPQTSHTFISFLEEFIRNTYMCHYRPSKLKFNAGSKSFF